MDTKLIGRQVLVLSDNDGLARVIELHLEKCKVQVVRVSLNAVGQRENHGASDDFDLVVLALSTPGSEPGVALNKASLSEQVGRVPLLIISETPCRFAPNTKLACLSFPFEIDELCCKVVEMLGKPGQQTGKGIDMASDEPGAKLGPQPLPVGASYHLRNELTSDHGRQTEYWVG